MRRSRASRILVVFAAVAAITPSLVLLLGAAHAPDYAFAIPGFMVGFAVVMLFASRRSSISACAGADRRL